MDLSNKYSRNQKQIFTNNLHIHTKHSSIFKDKQSNSPSSYKLLFMNDSPTKLTKPLSLQSFSVNKKMPHRMNEILTKANDLLVKSTTNDMAFSTYKRSENKKLTQNTLNKVKEMQYVQRWRLDKNRTTKIDVNKERTRTVKSLDEFADKGENSSLLNNRMLSITPVKKCLILCDDKPLPNLSSYSHLKLPNSQFTHSSPKKKKKNLKSSSMILKPNLSTSNNFKYYENKMIEGIKDYIQYKDKVSSYYAYDDQLKKDVVEAKVGLSLPGNILNYNSKGVVSFRMIHPNFIKTKFKRSNFIKDSN